MIVYRTKDLIKLSFKGSPVRLLLSPLDYETRSRIMAMRKIQGGEDISNDSAMAYESLRCGIKAIECDSPITYPDGSEFKLEFEEDKLTTESLDCLLQIFETMNLAVIAVKMLNAVYDFESLSGVKIESPEIKKKE